MALTRSFSKIKDNQFFDSKTHPISFCKHSLEEHDQTTSHGLSHHHRSCRCPSLTNHIPSCSEHQHPLLNQETQLDQMHPAVVRFHLRALHCPAPVHRCVLSLVIVFCALANLLAVCQSDGIAAPPHKGRQSQGRSKDLEENGRVL